MISFSYPSITATDPALQNQQINSYLHQLAEQLNYGLQHIGEENFSAATRARYESAMQLSESLYTLFGLVEQASGGGEAALAQTVRKKEETLRRLYHQLFTQMAATAENVGRTLQSDITQEEGAISQVLRETYTLQKDSVRMNAYFSSMLQQTARNLMLVFREKYEVWYFEGYGLVKCSSDGEPLLDEAGEMIPAAESVGYRTFTEEDESGAAVTQVLLVDANGEPTDEPLPDTPQVRYSEAWNRLVYLDANGEVLLTEDGGEPVPVPEVDPESIADFAAFFETYIRFGGDGVLISSSDSRVWVKLSNKGLEFFYGNLNDLGAKEPVAYINDAQLYIKDATILNSLVMPDKENRTQYVWNVSSTLGLTLQMVAPDEFS